MGLFVRLTLAVAAAIVAFAALILLLKLLVLAGLFAALGLGAAFAWRGVRLRRPRPRRAAGVTALTAGP